MHKTASSAMIVSLAALLGACGASADSDDGGGAGRVGRLSLAAPDDVAAAPADAEVTESGLASRRLEAGAGDARPFPTDTVRVHYAGWRPDGMLFDASERGPVAFGVSRVIRGWTEGLQLMVEGEVRRFWIPSELAYGDDPGPQYPAGDLVFDVELLEIVRP